MAQQLGVLKITGTIGGICFYCLDGVYYARTKSSLSAERVKKDPAFAATRFYAQKMGTAAKIASVVYRQLVPANERSRERYREVVGMVLRALTTNGTYEHEEERPQIDTDEHRWKNHELHERTRMISHGRTQIKASVLQQLAHKSAEVETALDSVCILLQTGHDFFCQSKTQRHTCAA